MRFAPGDGVRLNLVEEVLRACRADGEVAGHPVVVAVSGGPDSTALLHALTRARRRLRLQLIAAHLDHGIHAASRRHARAVATLCRALEVELVTREAGLGKASEAAARAARYAFLEGLAAERRAPTIALGHTADDQVETVLMHAMRGSGLEGIAAMAPREGLRFRPLLRAWRADVEAYCAAERLAFVSDPTNRDRRFLRNRVRRELVPLLEELAPGARRALLRLADAARDEHAAVMEAARAWLAAQPHGRPSRPGFRGLPDAAQAQVLRQLWAEAAGEAPGSRSRIVQARRILTRPEGRGMMPLGGGLELVVEPESFSIRPVPSTPSNQKGS